MQDDEYITTPTKRVRGNSVFEESLLNAQNYIKRKFSYGSSDWGGTAAHWVQVAKQMCAAGNDDQPFGRVRARKK